MIGWTVIAFILIWINWSSTQGNILDIARAEARTNIEKDLIYRAWNTSHGGVYAPVTENTQPNPYLNVPEREITTPSGKLLTLINPAYMTRQVYEIQKSSGLRAHLTSLNPLNPNNKADAWETQSLQSFETGVTEVDSIEIIEGQRYLRLMRPFITQEGCLKCHAIQGYKVGDVRGGLSVSVPMTKYDGIARSTAEAIILGYGSLWCLGLVGIYLVSRDLKKRFQEREALITSVEKSREKYYTILQTAMDGFWQMSLDGNLLEVNDAYCRMSGYSRAEILQMNVSALDINEKQNEVNVHIKNTAANIADRFEAVHRRKDGSLFPVEVSMHYLEEGKLFAFLRDMTGQKQAELALQESNRRTNETLQNIRLIAVSLDNNGDITFCNNFLLMVTGWKRSDLIGKNWFDTCLPQADRRAGRNIFEQFMCSGTVPMSFESGILTCKGSQRLARWTSTVLRDTEGRIIGISSIGEDITEQRQIQEALHENETLLLQAQQIANFGYYQLDIQSGIWKSSDILDKIFGIDKNYTRDVQGWANIVHPDEREEMTAYLINEVVGKKQTFDREYRIVRAQEARVRWVHGLGKLQFDEQGNPIRMIGAIQDITERKQAEQAIKESEEKYRELILGLPEAIAIYQDGKIVFVNHACILLMQAKNTEELLGKPVMEFVHPDCRELVKNRMLEVMQTGNPLPPEEEKFIRLDGTAVDVEVQASPIRFEKTPAIQLIIRDITERKRAEEALKKSEELYHNLVETSQDLIWECDAEGRYTYLNPAWEQAFGYKLEEMLGKKFSDFQSPEMAMRDQKEFNHLLKGNTIKGFETVHIAKSGRQINLVFNAKFLRDSEGKICGTLGTAYDITERKRTESENYEKAKELEALFNISSHLRTAQTAEQMIPLVLEQMSNTLSSDANAVILLDTDQAHFTYTLGDGLLSSNTGMKFEVENSISGHIMQTRQAYATEDYPNDPLRSRALRDSEGIGPAMLVPLQSESEFTGTLLCARAKDSKMGPFTPAEIKLLTAIGEMVGNALRRARLYDEALLRMQRVQALRSIDAAINANMDSVITLRVLINQILSLMKVDAAAVLLYSSGAHLLEYAATQGFQYRDFENAYLKLSHGFAKAAIIERRLIKIPNLAQAEDKIYREVALKEGFASCYIVPMIAKAQVCGILEVYSRQPLAPNQEWFDFLEALGGQAAIAINNAQLFANLEKSNLELSIAYDATIAGWSQALELRDKETEGHTLRVTDWTVELAKIAGLRESEVVHIRRGALLHDIGKMGIPDHILNKAGELTPREWKIMRQHPQYAYDMLSPITFLKSSLDIPYSHHERWDGTGYPRKLKGEQIPYIARLFSVIDVWDAVTSNRPYRKAWNFKKAVAHIKSAAGTQLDPQVVDLFLREIDRFIRKGMRK
jgi:PAS domain S-box-containing protein